MMFYILILCLAVIALVVFNIPVMKIKFSQGKLISVSGKVPTAFRHNLSDIAQRANLTGTVRVSKQNGQYRLGFSSSIPDNIRQRIRNVFPYNKLPKTKNSTKRER